MKRDNKKQALIAGNPRAYHDYLIEKTYEAGISLSGWEVSSLRAGRLSLKGSFVQIKKREAFLVGSHISPLNTCPPYLKPDAERERKLLLKGSELERLATALEQRGQSLVPIRAYWRNNYAKLELGLGKGKKLRDKRAAEQEKNWRRDEERALKLKL